MLGSVEGSRRNVVKASGLACRAAWTGGEEVGQGREALLPVLECPGKGR